MMKDAQYAIDQFQSTRPRRGAISAFGNRPISLTPVSIHAPPEGRDARARAEWIASGSTPFQSTRPRRGAIPHVSRRRATRLPFQSTRPRRGAMLIRTISGVMTLGLSFNPRAPGGARFSLARYHGRKYSAILFKCFNPRAPGGARYPPIRLMG